MAGDAQRAEISKETILLLTVKIDTEILHVSLRTESGFAVFWLKVIVIVRDIANEIYLPILCGLIGQVSLVIQKVGPVFTMGIHASQKISISLVTHAVEPRETLGGKTHISVSAQ